MANENVVSIQIDPKDLEAVNKKMQEIKKTLSPFLVALKPSERQTIMKMSDKTVPFVEKVMEYTHSSPEFIPAFMQVDEMEIDFKAMEELRQVYREVEQLCKNLDDTIMICGSEAYATALAYYNSVKQANKMNVPGAKSIYEDLSVRFQKK